MFGIGFGEMLVIAVVILIAVGPNKMPTFMKAVGKGLREFRRATRELKSSVGLDELLRDDDLRRPLAQKPRPAPRPAYELTKEDLEKERPKEGADLAHAKANPRAAKAEREEPKPEEPLAQDDVPKEPAGPVFAPRKEEGD
jgi:sec-independent protein translocase protein TatB